MTARGYVAQVQRLGREKDKLEAENTALREIVEAAFGGDNLGIFLQEDYTIDAYRCIFCSGEPKHGSEADQFKHTSDCPVTKARALLGQSAQDE